MVDWMPRSSSSRRPSETGPMTCNSKGYMRPEGWRPEIDEDESANVRRTFDMYVARASATGIAKVFNREGLRWRHHQLHAR